LGAGLLFQLPSISAQENEQEESLEQQAPVSEETVQTTPRVVFVDGDSESPALTTGSSVWVMIRMLLVLILAAVAIYGVVFFLKRSSKPAIIKDPFLKILASTSLGSSCYAHVVSVGSKAWLLGSGNGGVNLISEITDKDVLDAMFLEESRKTSLTQSGRFPDFVSLLRKLGAPAESRTPATDEIRKRRERLKGL